MSERYGTYDPLTFLDKEENILSHIEERKKEGSSFYDNINFDTFFTSVIFQILKAIEYDDDNEAELSSETKRIATGLHNMFLKYADALENRNIDPSLYEHGNFTKAFIPKFFSLLYPVLPRKKDYVYEEVFRKEGIDISEKDILGNLADKILINGLKFLAFKGNGHPAALEADEYKQRLLKVVSDIEKEQKLSLESINFITLYWNSFWD